LKKPFIIENKVISVSTAVGISIYPKDGTDARMLLKNADSTMYIKKKDHQHGYQFYN
jgi:GGDEF domain-containing protein